MNENNESESFRKKIERYFRTYLNHSAYIG